MKRQWHYGITHGILDFHRHYALAPLESANVFDTEKEAMDRLAYLEELTHAHDLCVVMCSWHEVRFGEAPGWWEIRRVTWPTKNEPTLKREQSLNAMNYSLKT